MCLTSLVIYYFTAVSFHSDVCVITHFAVAVDQLTRPRVETPGGSGLTWVQREKFTVLDFEVHVVLIADEQQILTDSVTCWTRVIKLNINLEL